MSKFNLFARSFKSATAASAAAAALAAGEVSPQKPEDDPEVPGEDDEDEGTGAPPVDAGPKPKPNPGCVDGEDGDADAGAAADGGGFVLMADAEAVAASQFAEGRKAERDRTAAVLGSDEGRGNPQMASWMLANSPDAGADQIIAGLKNLPAGAKAAAAPAYQEVPDTGVDLGNAAAAAIEDGRTAAQDADDVWAKTQGTEPGATGVFVSPDAGARTTAAIKAGARTVNTPAPSQPVIPPTGY